MVYHVIHKSQLKFLGKDGTLTDYLENAVKSRVPNISTIVGSVAGNNSTADFRMGTPRGCWK